MNAVDKCQGVSKGSIRKEGGYVHVRFGGNKWAVSQEEEGLLLFRWSMVRTGVGLGSASWKGRLGGERKRQWKSSAWNGGQP